MPKAVAYIRVSDPKQVTDGNSLKTQEELARSYIQTKGYELLRLFVESGESAKTDNRPVLKEMLGFCRENRTRIDVVVIPKIDRLSRNIYDYIGLKSQLTKLSIRLESIGERIEDSPVGRFTENVLASVAQFDNEIRAERSKGGMIQAVREGRWVWRAPLGYRSIRVDGRATIEPDPATAPLVSEIFTRIANGNRLVDIRAWLGAQGMAVSRSNFHRLISNPIYRGEIRSFGLTVRATSPCAPLVSRYIFAKAQKNLVRKNLPRTYMRDNPSFPLRGTLRCECGRFLYGTWSRGRSQRYAYYLCRHCPRTNLRKEFVERVFILFLTYFRLSDEQLSELRTALQGAWISARERLTTTHDRLADEISKTHMLQQALALKNAEGIVPDDVAKKQIGSLESKRLLLEAELGDAAEQEPTVEVVVNFANRFLNNLGQTWREVDLITKKGLQKLLFGHGIYFGREGQLRTAQEDLSTGLLALFPAPLSRLVGHEATTPNPVASGKLGMAPEEALALLLDLYRGVKQELPELFQELTEDLEDPPLSSWSKTSHLNAERHQR